MSEGAAYLVTLSVGMAFTLVIPTKRATMAKIEKRIVEERWATVRREELEAYIPPGRERLGTRIRRKRILVH